MGNSIKTILEEIKKTITAICEHIKGWWNYKPGKQYRQNQNKGGRRGRGRGRFNRTTNQQIGRRGINLDEEITDRGHNYYSHLENLEENINEQIEIIEDGDKDDEETQLKEVNDVFADIKTESNIVKIKINKTDIEHYNVYLQKAEIEQLIMVKYNNKIGLMLQYKIQHTNKEKILKIAPAHIAKMMHKIKWYTVNCAISTTEKEVKTKNYNEVKKGWYINVCIKNIEGQDYILTTQLLEVIRSKSNVVVAVIFEITDETLIVSGSVGVLTETNEAQTMREILNGLVCIGFAKITVNKVTYAIAATFNKHNVKSIIIE